MKSTNSDGVYRMYNKHIVKLANGEDSYFKGALRDRRPFHEVYKNLNFTEYFVYNVHVRFRPTLKRLAALELIDSIDDGETDPSVLKGLPITLQEDVGLCRQLWALDVFLARTSSFQFSPCLNHPTDVVGKEMLLISSDSNDSAEYQLGPNPTKLFLRSPTPDWSVVLTLVSTPSRCFDGWFCEANVPLFEVLRGKRRKWRLVFLAHVDEFFHLQFHYLSEDYDFSI